MLRLAKAFLDIALWRRSPAQLPASRFFLGLAAVVVGLLEVIGAFLPPYSPDGIVMRVILSVGLPLLWAWAVLRIAGRRDRFLQTGTALLGIAALAQVVLYPLGSLLAVLGVHHPAAIPLGVVSFGVLLWYLLACTHIWRAALESGIALGAAVSLGYLLLSIVLEQQFLPDN
jgi:hypothetical protein